MSIVIFYRKGVRAEGPIRDPEPSFNTVKWIRTCNSGDWHSLVQVYKFDMSRCSLSNGDIMIVDIMALISHLISRYRYVRCIGAR